MYIVRDVFYLQFGHYKEAKALLDEAYSNGLLPDTKASRVLSDFTGESYRLVLEDGFDSLADYEQLVGSILHKPEWRDWYDRFKAHVVSSQREILKLIL
jgi:hypothetical protein